MKPARSIARHRRPVYSALFALAVLLPGVLRAQPYVFAPSSGDWSNELNWQTRELTGTPDNFSYSYSYPGVTPDSTTRVYLNNGRTATLGASTSGSAFIVDVGERDNLSPYAETSATLNLTGGTLTVYDLNINYGSTVNVSAGTLFSADDSTPASSSLHVNAGTLNLTDSGAVRIGLNGVGTLYMQPDSGAAVLNIGTGAAAGTLYAARVAGNSRAVVAFNHTGDVILDSRLVGQLSVTKSGAGTTSLTGASTYDSATGNTYSGGTTINEGTLRSDGGFSGALGTGAVTVNAGGTLAGYDSVAGRTTVKSGGHLAPDAGGLLRFDDGLTLEDGAVLDLSLGAGPPYSILVNGGVFNAAGIITVNLADSGTFAEGTYTLVDFNLAGEVNNTATFQLGTQIAGFTTVLSFDGAALVATATAASVPEPSACAALAGFGVLALALARRRR